MKKETRKLLIGLGITMVAVGFILVAYGAGSLNIIRGKLSDKNGDGTIDWHDADVNSDGAVNVLDAALISSKVDKPSLYDTKCDLNSDGVIDTADLEICSAYHGLPGMSLFGALFSFGTIYSLLFVGGLVVFVLGLAFAISGKYA